MTSLRILLLSGQSVVAQSRSGFLKRDPPLPLATKSWGVSAGCRFENDTERLEKLFELDIKVTEDAVRKRALRRSS